MSVHGQFFPLRFNLWFPRRDLLCVSRFWTRKHATLRTVKKIPGWNNNLSRMKSELMQDFKHRHQDRERYDLKNNSKYRRIIKLSFVRLVEFSHSSCWWKGSQMNHRAKVCGFQTHSKKNYDLCRVPKTHHQNFSLQF